MLWCYITPTGLGFETGREPILRGTAQRNKTGLKDTGSMKMGKPVQVSKENREKPSPIKHHHIGWIGADSVKIVCTKPPIL